MNKQNEESDSGKTPSCQFSVHHDIEVDRVFVYNGDKLVGECEAYELDAICAFLGVEYEEIEEAF